MHPDLFAGRGPAEIPANHRRGAHAGDVQADLQIAAMADAASPGFTFILIHGARQGAWAWGTIVPRLKALGHDAIAVDLPGNGHNPMAPAEVNLERYAAHVAGIIDATKGPIVMRTEPGLESTQYFGPPMGATANGVHAAII